MMQNRIRPTARRRALIPVIAFAGIFAAMPAAMADQQRSDEAPDYALSWGAATGSRGAYAEAPARPYYPPVRHRRHY
jgi:hypothetical protein